MSFYERYELLELTNDGPVKTFAARRKDNGRQVSVHLLPGGWEAHPLVMERLRDLPESARQEVIEQGEHEGTVFVVTEPWLRRGTFSEWVLAAKSPEVPYDPFAKAGSWRIPTVEFGKKSAKPGEPGEFTRMFQRASPTSTPPMPEPVAPDPPSEPHPEPPTPPHTPVVEKPGMFTSMFQADQAAGAVPKAPGEFTRQFQTAPPPRPSDLNDTVEMPPPPVAPPPPAAAEPGEFTRMFQAPQAVPKPAEGPGEFTRMFRAEAPTVPFQTEPAQTKPTAPPPPAAPPQAAAGEFTRMFQAAAPPKPVGEPVYETKPIPPQATEPGAFTRQFQAAPPAKPVGEPAPPPPPPAAAPPPAQRPVTEQPSAAGEFTRFFQTPPPNQGPTAHPAFKDPFGSQGQTPAAGGRPAGEFTRMFGVPSVPGSAAPPMATPTPTQAPPPPPPQQQPQAGAYTRMFSPGAAPVMPSMPSVPSAPSMPSPPPMPSVPQAGEYTRMFQTPQAPQAPAMPSVPVSAPAPAPAARPVKKASYVPLFVGLGVLLLIAVILILVFALRK